MLAYLQAINDPQDRTRFEAMYSAYRGLMFHVANRILQNPQDAEDAVHLAFLSLVNCHLLPELGPQARHLAAVTAERKAIDLYRAQKRRPEVELEEESLPGCAPPPSDGTLAGAMAALPPRYREALLLKYYNGYSAAEIGELLGTTAANVRQLIARAKKGRIRNRPYLRLHSTVRQIRRHHHREHRNLGSPDQCQSPQRRGLRL